MKTYTNKLIFFLILLTSLTNKSYSIESKIVLKINNDIITSLDIKKESTYLLNLNPNIKDLSNNEIFNIAKNSLIREKIKKREILKNFQTIDVEQNITDQFISNMYEKINLSSKKEFQNFLKQKKLSLNYVEEKIKIEILWNRLIYSKFKSKLKINSSQLREEILKNKEKGLKEFFLQEILFDVKDNTNFNKKFKIIQESIKEQGFEKTALLYSESDTSQNNGIIGWIKENSLNKNILNEINNLKVGEITKPITIPGGFLILKIVDLKIKKEKIDIEKELSRIIKIKSNQQLNQYSLIFYNKIKKDLKINEL